MIKVLRILKKRLPFPKLLGKHLLKKPINLPFNQPQVLKNTQTKLSFSKCKPKNENPVLFKLSLKVNDLGPEIQPPSSNSATDQSLPRKVTDSSSQTQPVSSNSAVVQSHFSDFSSSNSKPDIKTANRVLPEAPTNLKNKKVLTSNLVSNKITFPSFIKFNSDALPLEAKEHTYKYYTANFRYRESNLSDIQRKEIIQNMFVPNSSFHFPKINGRQFKRDWLKQFPWLCYSPNMDSKFCLACVLFDHEFAECSKVKLLTTDPGRSSPSAVTDFKRHVEGKRKKKDSDRNRTLHKDTSALLFSVQEKMERNLKDVYETLERQFKFEVSENRKMLRSITDTLSFWAGKTWL